MRQMILKLPQLAPRHQIPPSLAAISLAAMFVIMDATNLVVATVNARAVMTGICLLLLIIGFCINVDT